MEACRIILLYIPSLGCFAGMALVCLPICDDIREYLDDIGMLERQMTRKDPVCSLTEVGLGMAG
mgnify:CR=1 FL=1